jgi:hypothetical protein
VAPVSGSPVVGVVDRSKGFWGSRGVTGSLPKIVSTALLGEPMPIGEAPNSETWIVFDTSCTPWSTIGTANDSLATPAGKSSSPLTDWKSSGSTAVHSCFPPHLTPSPSVM